MPIHLKRTRIRSHTFRAALVAGTALAPLPALSQNAGPSNAAGETPARLVAQAQPSGQVTQLPTLRVIGQRRRTAAPRRRTAPVAAPAVALPQPTQGQAGTIAGTPPVKQRYELPQTAASVTAPRIAESVNAVDTEDAVKYLPSLFVRKRNYGDTQPVLATRTWGIGASARSLVYADDILLSALIHNNNSIGAPRWGLVAPEEIQRIDFLYGPFAAMYPGNSVGGVLQITTKMPDKPVATFSQTEAFQSFNFYKTDKTFETDQTSATYGNRWNAFSMFVSGNFQNSFSQPLAWVTTPGTPAGATGTIPQLNRTGGVANVVGAGGLLHTQQETLKAKFALDITPWLTATYIVGFWADDAFSNVQTYLRDAAGNPTYGGVAGFASNYGIITAKHLANAFSLKTDTRGAFDMDLAISRYDILEDSTRNPYTVGAGRAFSTNGKSALLTGTNWTNADLKGIWRPTGIGGAHEVSFGLHGDQYVLNNPTYALPVWNMGPDHSNTLYTDGRGTTQTMAAWAQDAWRFAPQWKLTLGARAESWHAYDGFNLNTLQTAAGGITSTTAINQPDLSATAFSPKASLAWEPNKDWLVTASFGAATRFPTVGELYQSLTQGGQVILPNPNLAPERALSTELAIERKFVDGKVRLSFFEEDMRDALISQGNIDATTGLLISSVVNVDKTRTRGVEFAWQKNNLPFERVEMFGSVTYADPRIVSDPTFVSATGTTATGKMIPNVPAWRATVGATYRPTDQWAFTLVGRYQSKTFSTLDNTDVVPNVFQAFDPFFVVDTRIQYKVSERGSIAFGIDNIGNAKYTLFHPFPQRTYVLQGKLLF
jgi:iron complex outermembrane receptor protein